MMKALTSLTAAAAAVVALSLPSAAMAEPCGGTYTECRTNQCAEAVFYLNYNPTTDHFSDEYGRHLIGPEKGDIRKAPYTRYGPRGVRAMHAGKWGFYSVTCFPS